MSYGRLNQRKINEKDYVLSCQKARQELSDYINQQAKRVNIDSAKKRAVIQHMDYQGFRQMVLGANIFPTKTRQLQMFTKGQQKIGLGQQIEQNEDGQQKTQKKKVKKVETIEQSVQGKSQKHCTSFRQFKKKFMGYYSKDKDLCNILECYNLVKQQNEVRLSKIFNSQCQANILLKITQVFSLVLNEMAQTKTEGIQNQCSYMLLFFKYVLNIPTMKTLSLLILSKKQKQKIADFISDLQEYIQDSAEQIKAVYKLIQPK